MAKTMIGTEYYAAPEVIQQKAYPSLPSWKFYRLSIHYLKRKENFKYWMTLIKESTNILIIWSDCDKQTNKQTFELLWIFAKKTITS
jgi:serine/threonine protein kinase